MQEVNLKDLIEKIKKEGVERAEERAAQIINDAQAEAKRIKEDALGRAKEIEEEKQRELAAHEKSVKSALAQSARDIALSLKQELEAVLDAVLKKDIGEVLSHEFLKELIMQVVDGFSSQKNKKLRVALAGKDKEEIEKFIASKLKRSLPEIETRIDQEIIKGFHLELKGENAFYDFSQEAILEAIKKRLSPALAEMLKTSKA